MHAHPVPSSLSNATPGGANDKHDNSQHTVDELGQGHNPGGQRLAAAFLQFVPDGLVAVDPEEDDAGHGSAQGADIDGHRVHPGLDDALNEGGHDDANAADGEASLDTIQAELLLQGGDGRLEEVDEGGHASKEHRHKEDDDHDAAARHAVKQVGQEDEHQARAALIQLDTGGGHGGDDDQGCQHGGQGIKNGHGDSGADGIFLVGQVGAVNDRAVARQGQ